MMMFEVTQSPSTPTKNSISHRSKTKKSPRFRNEQTMKAKIFQKEALMTQALDTGLPTSVSVPRRRRSEQRQLQNNAMDDIPYAGAKFSSPPPPSVLPKPPSHWITSHLIHNVDVDVATAMSQHLRMLLRVES